MLHVSWELRCHQNISWDGISWHSCLQSKKYSLCSGKAFMILQNLEKKASIELKRVARGANFGLSLQCQP